MYSWVTYGELANWSGGKFSGQNAGTKVTSISTDTRTIRPGDVFAAIRGPNFDGHRFIDTAIEKGAALIICEQALSQSVSSIHVDDTLQALVQIGSEIRNAFKGKVVAVTGSAGKSSTKEMVATLLGETSVKSPASFNNLLGVSKTCFLISDETEFLVLEMGMNARGELRELFQRFHPNYVVLNNIGDAHAGKLGGVKGVYQAKKEVFEAINEDEAFGQGVALNLDDELVLKAYGEAVHRPLKQCAFSVNPKCEVGGDGVKISSRSIDPQTAYLNLTIEVGQSSWSSSLPIFGLHQANNLAAAIAVAKLLGIGNPEIKERIRGIEPATHRGQVVALDGERTLIDESYNSNPTALLSALTSLSELDRGRRMILVLGDMRELEDLSRALHEEVGRKLAVLFRDKGIDFEVIGVGTDVKHLIDGVIEVLPEQKTVIVTDWEQSKTQLEKNSQVGDIIFVKSSNGLKLHCLPQALREAKWLLS